MSSYGGRGPTVNAALWTETAIAAVFVFARVYTRVFILRSAGWDDALLIITLVCIGHLSWVYCPITGLIRQIISPRNSTDFWSAVGPLYSLRCMHLRRDSIRHWPAPRRHTARGLHRSPQVRNHWPGRLYLQYRHQQGRRRRVPAADRPGAVAAALHLDRNDHDGSDSVVVHHCGLHPVYPGPKGVELYCGGKLLARLCQSWHCYVWYVVTRHARVSVTLTMPAYAVAADFILATTPIFILWDLNMKRKDKFLTIFGLGLGVLWVFKLPSPSPRSMATELANTRTVPVYAA